MEKRLTKQQLTDIRDSSYKPPPPTRCATCEWLNTFSDTCFRIQIRGHVELRKVDPAGVCDLWEEKRVQK